ncbi:hypothetical protein ACFL20_01325 [Spirochaetota bacterium]
MDEKNRTVNIMIETTGEGLIHFYSILQRGFYIHTKTGISIFDFLVETCRIDPGYITGKIKSIFLNSKPVDDYKKAIVRDGITLALSGPMPGLVGAVMRAGSGYSSFRSTITHREEERADIRGMGYVFLKLFNVIMSDLGEKILGSGIVLEVNEMENFLKYEQPRFWDECKKIFINDGIVQKDKFKKEGFNSHGVSHVLLRVKVLP